MSFIAFLSLPFYSFLFGGLPLQILHNFYLVQIKQRGQVTRAIILQIYLLYPLIVITHPS